MEKANGQNTTIPPVDHSGHRKRLKNRMMREGLASFEDHNVLELLLFYTIPRADTNETGHRLLNKFGSIAGVLNATPEALMSVPGVGHETAVFLHMLPQLFRLYGQSTDEIPNRVDSIEDIAKIFNARFIGLEREELHLICLNAKNMIVSIICVSHGDSRTVDANVRKIVSEALKCNAVSVVMAHNHPSGNATPSMEDYNGTRRIVSALNAIDVSVVDHLVFAGSRCTALSSDVRFNSLFKDVFKEPKLQFSDEQNVPSYENENK